MRHGAQLDNQHQAQLKQKNKNVYIRKHRNSGTFTKMFNIEKWTGHHMRLIAALICDALAVKVHYHVSYYGLNTKSDQTESSDAAESDAC